MVDAKEAVTLRSGEPATLEVIRAPAPGWAERIERMLLHKGEPWTWQNSALLRRDTGAETLFFVLHRDGAPFANIMLMLGGSVGLLGHVWTSPADRGGGASALLMDRVIAEFRVRGGRALFLGTEFDTMPWHYYRRRGFEPVEPGSGFMAGPGDSAAAFDAAWFGPIADVVAEPLDWRHLVPAVPLFLGAFDGAVRLASVRLLGRRVCDEALLPLLRAQDERRPRGLPASACVLRDRSGTAVVGLACWHPDPLWPGAATFDVYCHPAWWHRAGDLMGALVLPDELSLVAYSESGHAPREAVLAAAGFVPRGGLPRHATIAPGGRRIDVSTFHRPPAATPAP